MPTSLTPAATSVRAASGVMKVKSSRKRSSAQKDELRVLMNDRELEALLGKEDAIFKELPGCSIEIKRTHDREYPYFVTAWACRLMLQPTR